MFEFGKAIIFKVVEVPGEDLETFSETKSGKGALWECLEFSFCRSGQSFYILRVSLGGHVEAKESGRERRGGKRVPKCFQKVAKGNHFVARVNV